MVAEVLGRRRIFVPMTRVTHIDSGQVYTTGLLNMRRFEQRPTETLVIGQMLDRTVTIEPTRRSRGTVYDVAMEQARTRDWVLSRVAVQEPGKGLRAAAARPTSWSGATWSAWSRREPTQGATHLIAALNEMRAGRRRQRASTTCRPSAVPPWSPRSTTSASPTCSRSCPTRTRSRSWSTSTASARPTCSRRCRADDAADLIADLAPETAATLLEPDGARRGRGRPPPDVLRRGDGRRDDDAGAGDPRPRRDDRRRAGPDPARRAARSRWRRWSTSAGSRWRRPTGRLLGVAHFQRLLREPPSTLVAAALDQTMDPLHPEATIDEVAAHLATYNLVAAPVVDDDGRLLGAVTVDDLLDHMLPENWRDQPLRTGTRRRR